ncbi:LysR family transcriptional regulator [Kaistia sp. 32K]|uniref:LysR family transcriptional regulator n=1 Tax=Kaistia sp. 32K TaxID=2795690 RepID=UPI001915F892|nr:LysR family transcriptional regulator [Kaistia sp. 32K]BCP54919.1 LysR family transcriptional regulator [Kaistia sp. 32K]
MSLTLQKLRNFLVIAEEGQFLRASQRVGISQPTLSAQIKELESELGVTLFSRTTRRIQLTTEGERFFERVTKMLSDLEVAVTEVREQAALKHGRVTIAATPSLANSVLPPLMAEFRRAFPDIDVRLLEEISEGVDHLVRQGIADFGVGPGIGRQMDLSFSPLFEERFFAVVPLEHPLGRMDTLPLAALPERELITLAKGTGIRDVLEQVLRDNGMEIGTSHVLTRADSVISLVEAGLGVGLLPELSVARVNPKRARIIPITEPEISRNIGLIERKGGSSSSASSAFLRMLRAGDIPERIAAG